AASADQVIRIIGEFICQQDNLLKARIRELEKRVADLEAAKYSGVYQKALAYPIGAQVTFNNSQWTALQAVPPNCQPGTNDAWQLSVKGRDHNGDPRKPSHRSRPLP